MFNLFNNNLQLNTKANIDKIYNYFKIQDLLTHFFIRFLILFLLISFTLFIILKGEKPGYIAFKNNYYIFFMAILPAILLSFLNNYFKFYIEEYLSYYIDILILKKIDLHLNEEDTIKDEIEKKNYHNKIIIVKSIVFNTIILCVSVYFSYFLKLIIDKGFSKYSLINQNYNESKNNLLFQFIGIIIGGLIFLLFYLTYLYKKYTAIQPKKINYLINNKNIFS